MKRLFRNVIERFRQRRARVAARRVAASNHSGIRSVTEAPLPGATRWLLGGLIGFVVVTVAWSSVGKLDVTAVAEGTTIVSTRLKPIQSPERAVVKVVLVDNGDHVAAGEPLIRMRSAEVLADARSHEHELHRSRAAVARLEALLRANETGGDTLPALRVPDGIPQHLVERERELMRSQWLSYRGRRTELQAERANRAARVGTIEASIESIEAVLPYLRDRVARMSRLVERNAASRQELDDARRELIDRQQERRVEQHRLAEARAELGLVKQRLQSLRSEFRAEQNSSLAEFEARVASAKQKLIKARAGLERRTLRAPIDGIVQDLAVHTSGEVARPADVLMRIVPEDQPLEIEARILNRDIGFAFEGQQVEVKFQAFDFTRYGAVPGAIREISPASIEDEQLGRVYRALVALKRPYVMVEGERQPLRPGMTATIDIDMGHRRIVEYFLAPLLRYRDEALQER